MAPGLVVAHFGAKEGQLLCCSLNFGAEYSLLSQLVYKLDQREIIGNSLIRETTLKLITGPRSHAGANFGLQNSILSVSVVRLLNRAGLSSICRTQQC
jgi:hypothetical protein